MEVIEEGTRDGLVDCREKGFVLTGLGWYEEFKPITGAVPPT